MVGSEEVEPGDGWSYDKFLSTRLSPTLRAPMRQDWEPRVVDAYRDYYGDRDATTLSALDLTKVDNFWPMRYRSSLQPRPADLHHESARHSKQCAQRLRQLRSRLLFELNRPGEISSSR